MKIGSDLDSCILDTATIILEKLGKPGKRLYNSISRYNIEESLNIPMNIVEKVIEYVLNLEDIPYLLDVEKYLPRIYSLCDEFSIITLRKTKMLRIIHQYIKNILGDGNEFRIYLCNRYNNGNPNKVDIVKKLDLDIFIEDRFSTAVDVAENTSCKVFLFDQPWNRRDHHGLTRVYSWQDIYNKLIEMGN